MSLHLPLSVPSDPGARLEQIARALFDAADADDAPPDLVGVVPGGCHGASPVGAGAAADDTLVVTALTGVDPASGLLGFSAPRAWWAAGVVAGADVRPVGSAVATAATCVHLVARDGTSVTIVGGAAPGPTTIGPTDEPVEGRLADACRRIFGLPTAPAPADMTAHVVDVWLTRVARAALEQPGLDWAAVAAHNPANELGSPCTSVPSPATLARRTAQLGEQLDWDRYRLRCVEADRTPFGGLDAQLAGWMDAGMFARWMLDEALPWRSQMELLDGLLAPGAGDRLWAALALCPVPDPAVADAEGRGRSAPR